MDKKSRIRFKRTLIYLVFLIGILSLYFVSAPSFNPQDTRAIGYELLNETGGISSNGNIIHLWNINHDYFINKTSGIQLTNHFQEYWSRNKWCVYLKFGSKWNKFCSDEFSWSWLISTDNLTYVNATGHASNNYPGGYKIEINLEYYLNLNDQTIRITPYIKNTGNSFEGNLIWRVQDIRVSTTDESDVLEVNDSEYLLNNSLSLDFSDLNDLTWRVKDNQTDETLDFYWNESIFINGINYPNNYTLKIYNETGQYNTPIELWMNVGTINKNDNFYTIFRWIDGKPGPNVVTGAGDSPDPIIVNNNITFVGTGTSAQGYTYQLVVCNSSTFDASGNCAAGQQLCRSASGITSGNQASCQYNVINNVGTFSYWVNTENSNGDEWGAQADGGGPQGTWTSVAKPIFSSPSINETTIFSGMYINHSITVSNSPKQYLFSWNGSGASCDTWANSSWITISGSSIIASNVSYVNSACTDKTIGWQFCANNSAGINCSSIQLYNVSSYGTLTANLTYPGDNIEVTQNTIFDLNASVTCSGGANAKCGIVSALARYNKTTATPDTAINNTSGTPFFLPNIFVEGNPPYYYDGWNFSLFSENTNPTDICFNGTYFWSIDWYTDIVFRYLANGTYNNWNFSVLNEGTYASGITFNGTYFWVIQRSDERVYRYLANGTYDNYNFSISLTNLPESIVFDGTFFWIASDGDNRVYKYTAGGVYDSYFSIADTETDVRGIAFNGTYFWIVGDGKVIYRYLANGTYNNWNFSIPSEGDGIVFNGTYFYTINDYLNLVYRYAQNSSNINLNPKSQILNQGQSWNVTWTINATGTNNAQWELGVLFNSSYGSSNVPDNHTQNITICIGTCAPTDTVYPQFSNYLDNNGSLKGGGIGLFNVTVLNTNGTVLLEINNTNITASNLTASVYNVSYNFTDDGVYSYRWHSWGNGTNNNYNKSTEQSYTVNLTCTCPNDDGTNWEVDMGDYCVLNDNCVAGALTFINTGNFTCNAVLNISSVGGLTSGQRGYIKSLCNIIDRT